ncbi:MAG: glycosyl hydrolase [Lachnospiraceae bacterium]|nr:glycosyl hydrolase [Lachnospiraceae bacterium]
MKKDFSAEKGKVIAFENNVDFCVGTGRMGLALQREYMEQLKAVQEDIGFKYIRGHGLFSDDMAIYHEYKDENDEVKVEYNFTYLDLVMDNYLKLDIRPFIELGFMPYKLASGTQTIFYWRGNTTPPKSYEMWNDLVVATLKHLMDRYGADEVVTWPIEVWNEPNLPGFWEKADMNEYLVLFENSFNAIKKLDSRFRIGGPAICGVEDVKHMRFFMDFLKEKKIKIDFITRHHYTSEPPERGGHYSYIQLTELNESFKSVENSREIIDSYPEYKGLEMHITEFNTSYVPNAPIHDTNRNAAYVASMLAKFPETCASYSYWTFGDIFEEMGVPFSPFYGGFGMMANRGIRKPTYYAFKFFKDIKANDGACVIKNENSVVCLDKDGVYRGVVYNSRTNRNGENLEVSFTLPADADKYTLITKLVDEKTCNPLKVWHDLGEPVALSEEQIELLKASDKPAISTAVVEAKDANAVVEMKLDEFALMYFELKPLKQAGDRGYDYNRVEELG